MILKHGLEGHATSLIGLAILAALTVALWKVWWPNLPAEKVL